MRYRDFLKNELSEVVSSDVLLPSGFHLVGHVALVHLNIETMKYAQLIGEKTLQYDQRILSVAVRTGPTEGTMRLPSYVLVAGNSNTSTTLVENGVKFRVDPLRLTFSGGNRKERLRLGRIVKNDEVIVDMFSCVGQFALHIAYESNVKVIAIEINPEAYHFLLENIKLNNLENKVTPILGDCREVHPKGLANRVVMGYLHNTIDYLPFALETLVESGGVIHMHMNTPKQSIDEIKNEIEEICRANGYTSTTDVNLVKNYSPGMGHYVFDISVTSEA
ncbi:MAG: class I SAM-dependent methyltransferase family protein [Candidatus Thorarchaeota archaeon]